MTHRIIYTNETGGVSIVVPAEDCGLTIEEIAEKDCPAGSDYEIVDVAVVPSDRTFRGAWRKETGKIDVDLSEAIKISHEIRRNKRSEEYKLADGDNEFVVVTPAAQVKRDAIKAKYDKIQIDLDNAKDVSTLKVEMEKAGLV